MIYKTIDLRECEEGDILISSHGSVLKYIRPTHEHEYLDHVVVYTDNKGNGIGYGTRTNDGYVFKHNRKPETDHDIVAVVKNLPIRYTHIFQLGTNEHLIEVYDGYTKDGGLGNLVSSYRNTRYGDLLREVKKSLKNCISKEQLTLLKDMMKHRSDGIVLNDGKYFKN